MDIKRPPQNTDRLSREAEAGGPPGIDGYAVLEEGSTKINHGDTFRGPSQGYPSIYGRGLEIIRKQSREWKGRTYFCQSQFPSHCPASFSCYPETSYRTEEPSSHLFRWLHRMPWSFHHFCLFYININLVVDRSRLGKTYHTNKGDSGRHHPSSYEVVISAVWQKHLLKNLPVFVPSRMVSHITDRESPCPLHIRRLLYHVIHLSCLDLVVQSALQLLGRVIIEWVAVVVDLGPVRPSGGLCDPLEVVSIGRKQMSGLAAHCWGDPKFFVVQVLPSPRCNQVALRASLCFPPVEVIDASVSTVFKGLWAILVCFAF